jgi:hypothetical protein
MLGANIRPELLFKSPDPWAGRQPAGPKRIDHLGDFFFPDRGAMKRNSSLQPILDLIHLN